MTSNIAERAAFRALSQASAADWKIIEQAEREHRRRAGPGAGLLRMLRAISGDAPIGTPVSLFTHCLQTATRVLDAGRDDELVVMALFHDLPEAFSDNHHGLLAAEMLAPRLSERRRWMLIHHVEFQALHFANHPTRDQERARDIPRPSLLRRNGGILRAFRPEFLRSRLPYARTRHLRAYRAPLLRRTGPAAGAA